MTITEIKREVQIGDLLLPPSALQDIESIGGEKVLILEIDEKYYGLVKERLNQQVDVALQANPRVLPATVFKWQSWKQSGWRIEGKEAFLTIVLSTGR